MYGTNRCWLGALIALTACAPVHTAPAGARVGASDAAVAVAPALPDATYWVYVGAESADVIHRIRFGPDGAAVEKTTGIGERVRDIEGPHGLAMGPDGRHLFMTTGHGVPDGKFWKIAVGPDTAVARPIDLGRFPASLDVTPDGDYAFIVNFNLHGEMVPSTVSVVYTPDMVEVVQIETCTMPHGSRINARGTRHYSACMMDDQLVEIDTHSFRVSRRFGLEPGREAPIEADAHAHHGAAPGGRTHEPGCSPTWVQPAPDGRRIFVACNRSDEVLEIDADAWSFVRRLPTGRGPYNVDVTPDGRLLVVTLKQGNAVEFFDVRTGRSLARLPTSTSVVHGIAISPDSRYAFVSVEGIGAAPGKVDIFELGTLQRVAAVDVRQQASGITFWKMEKP